MSNRNGARCDVECHRQGGGRVESRRGFLLNHLITDELPASAQSSKRFSNSDPITGQAAWYDVRVRVYPAEADADHTLPQFTPMHAAPGSANVVQRVVQTYFAGRGEFAARLRNAVKRNVNS